MAKSGKKEALEAAEQQQKIADSNIGHKLLSKMGWKVCFDCAGSPSVRPWSFAVTAFGPVSHSASVATGR